VVVFFAASLYAQDDSFGFGFDDDGSGASGGALPFSVNIAGEARIKISGFTDDFDDAKNIKLGNMFSGKLNFEAASQAADAVLNLNIEPEFKNNTWNNPFSIDEAFGRFYFGALTFEGGIRKLTWGKADSFGPLDVINPIDYSDLSKMSDLSAIKIARPLLHLTINTGDWTKIEGVFVPWFSGNLYEIDIANRWAPSEIKSLSPIIPSGGSIGSFYPNTESLQYFQGGLRGTTTVGSSDVGVQYYYGRLFRPAINIAPLMVGPTDGVIAYNKYHQIGVDWARVVLTLNLRAELAGNITEDLKGDDGSVYNPFISWSLGFDRDLFWGINLNLQASENIRLMHDKINANPMLDTEAGKELTSTRLTAVLSKKILQDRVEFKIKTLYGIEDNDCYIMPGIIWTREAVSAELSAGIFAGDKSGEFGQYRDNAYIKALLSYQF
jgi:hypothetical protein